MIIVAELSANHNHDKQLAIDTIKAAKNAGADAVKLQTYTPDTMTIDCDNKYFKIDQGTIWDGKTLYELYQEAYTPWEWHEELFEVAEREGLLCFSTPFDKTSVDFLETLNNPIYKIASFEITDIPLIEYIANLKKPIVISTGIATLQEIEEAVKICRKAGNNDITLLQCTSAYPSPIEEANLLTMTDMKEKFNVKTGISDHTIGSAVALASVALGADIVEKHFILDRSIGGPDSGFSMNPAEFTEMVIQIREIRKALGKVTYEVSEKIKQNRVFARSLFVVEDLKKGEKLTEQNIRSIRPGYGLLPIKISDVIGKTATKDILRGTPLEISMFE